MTVPLPKKKTSDTKPPAKKAAPVEPAVEKVTAAVAKASRYDDLTHDELVMIGYDDNAKRMIMAREFHIANATKF